MSKRKKGQSLDFVVGLLKKLARDPEVKGETRLKCIEYLVRIDRILDLDEDIYTPKKSGGQPAPEVDILDQLKSEIAGRPNA